MFRKRLAIALAVLAAAAVAEGLLAVWALSVAERQVQRGRVAGDIKLAFVELSATKQRLRTSLTESPSGPDAQRAQQQRLQADMERIWGQLNALSRRAVHLDASNATRFEHLQRQDTLAVLRRSLDELDSVIARISPSISSGSNLPLSSQALSQALDVSLGRDLRTLIRDSIVRESAAMTRERAATDNTLAWMRALWLGTAATLALAALLLAVYFARALRGPLDRLSAGVQALKRGDLAHRIEVNGADEFSEVAHSVNTMAAEIADYREREAKARHRLEELVQDRTGELQRALDTMQEMDARRRQMFADISHELRTPTTAIRGEAEVSLRGKNNTTDYYRAALQRIVDASRQLGLVIDDLLTATRSDTDSLALKCEPMDLTDPLCDALEQARAIANEREISVVADAPTEVFPILGDALRVRQMLMVVLDNAIRYSKPGGVVHASMRRVTIPGAVPYCEVLVKDQGIGIASEEIARVFERNFRGKQARRHRADGSGLGLSIGAALARAHGGEIILNSKQGVGTTVTLRLPLHQASVSRQNTVA